MRAIQPDHVVRGQYDHYRDEADVARDSTTEMTVQAKQPGPGIHTRPVDLRVDFSQTLGRGEQAYEKLLTDAIDGDAHRFAREDMIEQAWRVVGPVLDKGPIHRTDRAPGGLRQPTAYPMASGGTTRRPSGRGGGI